MNTGTTVEKDITPRKRRVLTLRQKEEIQGYLFISPWIIGLVVFILGPLLFSLYGSFTNYNVTSKADFIGIRNYATMFTGDPLFWKSLFNTIYYVIFSVPLSTIGAMLLAILLNQRIRGQRLYRTIFYLPNVLSGVAAAFIWVYLFSPESGLVNILLGWFGIKGPAWFYDPVWAKPAIIFMRFWGLGGGMLLFLASLQGVPQQLYESAEIDGANALVKFWNITLPMITPIVFYELIIGLISSFQIFNEAYIIYNGGTGGAGPMNSLLFYNFHMYNKAFDVSQFGYAMAMGWILFVIVMFLTLFNWNLSKLWVYYEGGESKNE